MAKKKTTTKSTKKKTSKAAKTAKKTARKTSKKATKSKATKAASSTRRTSTRPKLTYDMIAKRAYEIWQTSGCVPGRDQENWKLAEEQLKAERR